MKLRKFFTIRHPLQIKYLGVIFLAMLAPSILLSLCLYYIIFYLIANQMVFPEAIASNLLPVIGRVNIMLMAGLPILIVAFLWIGLVLSHRFVGPMDRVERELDRMIHGETKHRIRIRKTDDLAPIVYKINALADMIKTP